MKFNFLHLTSLNALKRFLQIGLHKLRFNENMEGFEVEVELPPKAISPTTGRYVPGIVTIENKLTFIPTKYIVLSFEDIGTDPTEPEATIFPIKYGEFTKKDLKFANYNYRSIKVTLFFMR